VKDDNKNDGDVDDYSSNNKLDEMELAELVKNAEKEEKEMDEEDNEDDTHLEDDLEEMEAMIRDDVESTRTLTQPVRRVLYKVSGCINDRAV